MKKIIVKFEFVFEFDADGYDPKHVYIDGLAKDSALSELRDLMKNGQITADNFKIIN